MKQPFPANIGIHIRLLCAAVLLISAATVTMGYLGVNIIHQFVMQRFNQRIEFMTQYLALNSELGILIDEQNLLQGLAGNMLKEDDIAGVEIRAHDGRVLVAVTRDMAGPFDTAEKKVFLSETEESPAWARQMTGGSGNGYIGQVVVTYSTRGIQDLVNRMTRLFVYIALALTLLAGTLFYFVSRSLVAPLIHLAEIARKVSSGNRSVRAAPGTTPEIARLADAFNDMLDSLAAGRRTLVQTYEKMTRQETLAEVGKFSMMIAHEVKNPLGIIKSSLEMMKSDLNVPVDNMLMTYAEEEIMRLNTLIESFLMFSRPARPRFEQVDLNQLLEQVVMGFEIQYDGTELDLDFEKPGSPFVAEADFDLLSRGIGNILKNACEASDGKGRVEIRVTIQKSRWRLTISDQGKGVSPEDRHRIFEPFFTTKATGSGLGLAFADQVIKAHGGSIRLISPPRGGAQFCITLFAGRLEQKAPVNENTLEQSQTH